MPADFISEINCCAIRWKSPTNKHLPYVLKCCQFLCILTKARAILRTNFRTHGPCLNMGGPCSLCLFVTRCFILCYCDLFLHIYRSRYSFSQIIMYCQFSALCSCVKLLPRQNFKHDRYWIPYSFMSLNCTVCTIRIRLFSALLIVNITNLTKTCACIYFRSAFEWQWHRRRQYAVVGAKISVISSSLACRSSPPPFQASILWELHGGIISRKNSRVFC